MTQTRHWGLSAPGGRGRGVKHILGKYQARGGATGNLPGERPRAPPALESDLLPSAPGGVSNLQVSPSFRIRPSTTPTFLPQSVTRRVCARRRAPPSRPPPCAPRHAPPSPASSASRSLPTPPAGRARAARTALGAALDKHLSRLGPARFGAKA